ncbi:Wzz/FepE/Etk N-terminal domain-containing protein [Undibacterium sp. Jales W-56]|uniref:Wzz/FepE/Etk N-terminal domain-containing protein n=1 Tax=Undibacterium sp. Jales W-56 TaxID=2897325 RepID=UPI0021CEBD1C|nr:Wzz/FepE/Etk N-terminal domain-containing protein [Undibacterium sp. Jales W-56]MCU6433259.1 Wzz/FepE/Etk N-terminal domain-containing protein [Undibacterium sp. Jales W-56]
MKQNLPGDLLLSFAQVGAMLRARRGLITAIVILAVAVAAIASLLLPKTYIASADLYIDYRINDPIGGRQFHPMQDESYLQTQFDVIKSVQVAERVIALLKLEESATGQRYIKKYGQQRGLRALAEDIVKNIEVTPHKSSRVVELEYASGDPQHAKDVVNAVVKSYMDLSLEMMNAPARARRDQYNAQLESMSRQMDELQKKLTTYQQEHQIIDTDERLDLDSKQMGNLSAKLVDVQLARIEAQTKRQLLERLMRNGNRGADIPEIAGIGNISGLKASISTLEMQLANARTSLGARHPRYIAIEAEIKTLNERLQKESATAVDALKSNEYRFIQEEKVIEGNLAGYQKRTLENKQHRDVISSYQRQLDSVQKIYNAAIQKFDELLMTSNVVISNATVMRWAELPERQSKPLLRNNLIFGLIAGVLLGFGVAFLLELSQRKVRCVDDLVREFDVPVLAKIGFAEKLFDQPVTSQNNDKLRGFHG